MPPKPKTILFVDDDPGLLEILHHLMGRYAGATWEILSAHSVSEALGILQVRRLDLLVLDIHMPVVDGQQFLGLLRRKYPNLLKVVMTSDPSESLRAACLNNGAELFLEKPRDDQGWKTIHATLNELAKFQPEEGFRGVLRRVGLEDVLQMECLARHSLVLRVHASAVLGAIYVHDGQIVHAQCGHRTGEDAFNQILTLTGGEFELQPYVEPPLRTISGSWEFLIMEAARKRDEAAAPPSAPPVESSLPTPPSVLAERYSPPGVPVVAAAPVPDATVAEASPFSAGAIPSERLRPQVEELLVCSLQGEVLHEWQCRNPNGRVGFLEFLSQRARQLAQGLPLGEFDRLEVASALARVVAQVQSDRGLFLHLRTVPVEGEANSFGA